MATQILAGTLLALASWTLALGVLVALGRWVAVLVQPAAAAASIRRASLWWGLLVAVVLTLSANLVVPLRSGTAGLIVLGTAVVLGVVGILLRRDRRAGSLPGLPPRSVLALLAALAVAAAYLAFKAIGPVTNYDTGLYHLGAIKYAGDFTTIPGLATLYFPFGYSNVQFPLAALLGNGPWDGVGYRLLNGLLVLAVMTDLAVRLLARRYSWGTFILTVGLGASLIPLVGLSDFLVTSPTADTAILVLTLVSTAYLADFLGDRRERSLNASVVAVTVIVMVSMRPTMAFFALASAVVVAASLWRQRSRPDILPAAWVSIGCAVLVMAALQVVRDRILSGWLLYPLSGFPFDVSWRAVDPTGWRDATLAAARDATAPDQYVIAHSWTWIPVWTGRLWTQWETYFLLLAVAAAAAAWVVARRFARSDLHPGRVGAAMLPSGVAVAMWFLLSPPSFRFIWGPLFCLAFIPLAAALHALHRQRVTAPIIVRRATPTILVAAGLVILVVTGYSAVARNQAAQITERVTWALGPVGIPYAIAPVPLPPVVPVTMTSGLVLVTPEVGDQCWDNYPLCSYSMGDDVALRGSSIQDGFIRQ